VAEPVTSKQHRDAAKTRELLLDVARRRFAYDGYAATTVREIADDACVNVALISRYFESKEGLFEACLAAAVDELTRAAGNVTDLRDVPQAIARQVTESGPHGRPAPVLLMLLRSSGDERAEQIRLGVLQTFSERLAAAAGWSPESPSAGRIMLRAQLVLSTSIGMTVLRASPGLQPLASSTENDLVEPLRDLVDALLAGPAED
jgi:AcrR family transcriptional regulator